MIIEFIGLPGSGKTTIANKLIDRLKDKGNVKIGTFDHLGTLQRISSKLSSAFTSIFLFPKDSFFVVKELFINHNSKKEIVRDALNILYLMARYHKARKERETIYVFDQGLIQAFLSSCMYGKWSDRIFDLVKKNHDRVILVNVSPDVSAERLSTRRDKSSRVQKSGVEIDNLAEQEKCLMKIITTLKINKSKVLFFNNSHRICPDKLKQIVVLLLKQDL